MGTQRNGKDSSGVPEQGDFLIFIPWEVQL